MFCFSKKVPNRDASWQLPIFVGIARSIPPYYQANVLLGLQWTVQVIMSTLPRRKIFWVSPAANRCGQAIWYKLCHLFFLSRQMLAFFLIPALSKPNNAYEIYSVDNNYDNRIPSLARQQRVRVGFTSAPAACCSVCALLCLWYSTIAINYVLLLVQIMTESRIFEILQPSAIELPATQVGVLPPVNRYMTSNLQVSFGCLLPLLFVQQSPIRVLIPRAWSCQNWSFLVECHSSHLLRSSSRPEQRSRPQKCEQNSMVAMLRSLLMPRMPITGPSHVIIHSMICLLLPVVLSY